MAEQDRTGQVGSGLSTHRPHTHQHMHASTQCVRMHCALCMCMCMCMCTVHCALCTVHVLVLVLVLVTHLAHGNQATVPQLPQHVLGIEQGRLLRRIRLDAPDEVRGGPAEGEDQIRELALELGGG